jgi:hypothetical protein
MKQNLQGRGLDARKKMRGETEIAVELAGDRRSWIAVVLHTGFRSQVHFVEFLRQSVLGVLRSSCTIRSGPLGSTPVKDVGALRGNGA